MPGPTCFAESSDSQQYRSFVKNHQFPGPHTSHSRSIEEEINYLLKYYSYSDAIFLAELYHEKENTEQTLYIYADCLMRANKKEEVFGMLNGMALVNPRLRYLFAKCCFELYKLDACQTAILDDDTCKLRKDLLDDPEVAPLVHFLYSSVLCAESHTEDAILECRKAVELNVMAWSAICAYIKYGGSRLDEVFEPHRIKVHEMKIHFSRSSKSSHSHRKEHNSHLSPLKVRTSPPESSLCLGSKQQKEALGHFQKPQKSSVVAPPPVQVPESKQVTPSCPPVRATRPTAPRKSSRLSEMAVRRSGGLFEAEPAHSRATNSSRNRMNTVLNSDTENVHSSSTTSRARGSTGAAVRGAGSISKTSSLRSSSKNTEPGKMMKSPSQRRREIIKQPLVSRNSNLVRSLSGSTNSISSVNDERPMEIEQIDSRQNLKRDESVSSKENLESRGRRHETVIVPAYDERFIQLFDLYTEISFIEEAVGKYNWKRATKLFDRIRPEWKKNLSICMHLMGRICFEQAEYGECRHKLEELHTKRPWRVEGTELLSTALWHLQDTHALSTLAQNLTTGARERSQSWCAAGNCFSLQRQHNQAVECLERAIQLDKRFAYAYTLLGHELIVQDELNRAAGSFRLALLLSPRDYRAWYGLGLVHLKREQNSMAQASIQKAIEINPTNRAMLCTLSQVEQQRGRTEKAIQLIDRALALNPVDVACRFNRAKLLFEAKRNEECLEELNRLKASSPDEAFVFHLLARVHRRMGSTHMALLNYSWAAELDPRGDQSVGESSLGPQNREEYEDDEYGSPV